MQALPYDVTLERDVVARMRDDVELRSDVYRPSGGGRHPVLLMRTSYGKERAQTNAYAHPTWFASKGYLVVVQDIRGRFASGGTFQPFMQELEDGFDSVEWAAALPGSDGVVGMYGLSYPGATQLLAAASAPPALRSISPAFTASQYFDGWTYRGGALELAFAVWWALLLGETGARHAGDAAAAHALNHAFANAPAHYDHMPLVAHPLMARYAPFFREWLEHPTADDYWRPVAVDEQYARFATPALHLAGWYDIFLPGGVKNFEGLRTQAATPAAREQQKLVIGPWHHLGLPTCRARNRGHAALGPNLDDWIVRWLDQTLKQQDTGVLDAPVSAMLLGSERWEQFASWPPPEAEQETWHLRGAGRANSVAGDGTLAEEAPGSEPPDVFTYDPLTATPSIGGASCCTPSLTPMGPADQDAVEGLNDVLVYTSPPRERDVVLAGPATVELFAATSCADTDFVARLCVVDPAGRSTNLAEGIVRASYRDSLVERTPVEPGEVYRYTIELGPVGAAIAAGNRLRLQVASSAYPRWQPNPNSGGLASLATYLDCRVATQTVIHDEVHPSRLTVYVMK